MNRTLILLLISAVVISLVMLTLHTRSGGNAFDDEKAERSVTDRAQGSNSREAGIPEAKSIEESVDTKKVIERIMPRIAPSRGYMEGGLDPRRFQPRIPGMSQNKTAGSAGILDPGRTLDAAKIREAKRLFEEGNLALAGKLIEKLEREMKDALIVDRDFAEFAVRYSCTLGDEKRVTRYLHMVSDDKKVELKDYCTEVHNAR